jgi:hypothetical protein
MAIRGRTAISSAAGGDIMWEKLANFLVYGGLCAALLFFSAFCAFPAAAQGAAAPAREGFGLRFQQNAENLRQYSSKRRTGISVKGHSRTRVEMVRYVDGKMETVPLETPQPGPATRPQGRGGPLRRMMLEKKKEEMQKEVERLRALLRQYAPGSDAMRSIFEKASVSRSGSGPDSDIRLEAHGVAQPKDVCTFIWSVANRRPDRMEIHTELDKKPVTLTVEYASLPEGPFYAARTVLSAPQKDLRVTIETFDYTRSAGQ